MPTWAWVLGALIVAVGFVASNLSRRRRQVTNEFVYYLQERHPEIRYVRQQGGVMTLQHGELTLNLRLHKLYIAGFRAKTREGRREAYEQFAQTLLESRPIVEPGPEHLERLRPRLVPPGFIEGLAFRVPSRPLGDTGLRIVYVIDNPNSVAYVTEEMLSKFGVDAGALHERAVSNLRPSLPREAVRGVLDKRSVSLIKSGDTYDAAHLLLVPEVLQGGETIAAVVPDRDTLGLLPVPEDGDWSTVRKLARASDGDPLMREPLRVTTDGFHLVA